MHLRGQIRSYVAALIQAAVDELPTPRPAVFKSRVYPTRSLPAISVFTEDELAVTDAQTKPVQFRELELVVEIMAKANTDIDDVVDTLSELTESAIANDLTLGGLCKNIYLQGSPFEIDDELEKPLGKMMQSWAVTYRVDTRSPDQPVP